MGKTIAIPQSHPAVLQHLFYLKGFCHEMNNFSNVLKIKSVFSVYAPIVFYIFSCLVVENVKDKVLAQIACSSIQEPAYDSVNCSVSRR